MFGSSMTTLPPEDLLGKASSAPTAEDATMTTTNQDDQFEDADDTTAGTTTNQASNTNALAWLAAAAEQSSLNTKPSTALPEKPEPARLQRRISTNTSNATSALLGLAMAASTSADTSKDAVDTEGKKKNMTFVARLEELKDYKERHGYTMNLENPIITKAHEQGLWTWLSECRKQYRAGLLSDEKAKALANVGCHGFGMADNVNVDGEEKKQEDVATMMEDATAEGDDASASRTEARHQKEHARRLEEHRMRELMLMEQQRQQLEHSGNLNLSHLSDEQIHMLAQQHQQEGKWTDFLWLQQQQEKERAQQMAGLFSNASSTANAGRRAGQDPDGTTLSDADRYPAESFQARMTHSLQEQRVLEELYAREALNREALLMREQRLAAAMAASRLGGAPGGFGGAGMPSFLQQRMSLLQPLETVSARDSFLAGMGGMGGYGHLTHHTDPHHLAVLRAQLMQQQEQLEFEQQQQQEQQRRLSDSAFGRRLSDASGSALGAPPVAAAAAAVPEEETPLEEEPKKKKATSKSAPTSPIAKKKKKKKAKSGEVVPNSSTSGGGGKPRKSWDERMKEMWNFFLTYGHTQVQTRGQHKELGRWLSAVRCRMRDGLLPQHHVKEFLAMQEWSLGEGATGEEDTPVATTGTTPAGSNHSSRRNSGSTVSYENNIDLNGSKGDLKIEGGGCSINNSASKGKRALPKSWNQSFVELQAFKARFGHAEVKMIGSSPYGLLGKWLASQRSRHKLGQLPEDKVKRLRDLGCSGFGPNPTKESEEGAQQPEEETHRRHRIHRRDDDECEFDAAIRRLKAAKELCQLEEAEPMIESAVSAEATPNNSAPNSPMAKDKRVRHSYETRVVHIKQFKEKYGHCKIKLGSTDKHEELLARWLASARSRYRGGQFKEERAAELRAMGCDGFEPLGSLPGDAKVENNDSKVVEKPVSPALKKREAPARTATPSPAPSDEEDAEDYGTGEAGEPASKKQRSNAKRQTFEDMLKELESYQYIYGVGCSVPKPDGEKGKLGRWLAFQRRQFIAGKLSADRVEKLKTIGRKEFLESALLLRAAEMSAASTNDQ